MSPMLYSVLGRRGSSASDSRYSASAASSSPSSDVATAWSCSASARSCGSPAANSLSLEIDERQEFAAQRAVVEKRAAHDGVGHLRRDVLHTAPVHAEVVRFHDHGQAVGLHHAH